MTQVSEGESRDRLVDRAWRTILIVLFIAQIVYAMTIFWANFSNEHPADDVKPIGLAILVLFFTMFYIPLIFKPKGKYAWMNKSYFVYPHVKRLRKPILWMFFGTAVVFYVKNAYEGLLPGAGFLKENFDSLSTVSVKMKTANTSTNNQLITSDASVLETSSAVTANLPHDLAESPQHQADEETFVAGETVYVAVPSAFVSYEGTVISLPIGASVEVKETAADEAVEGEEPFHEYLRIYIGEIFGDEIDPGYPQGLIPANRLSHQQPNLTDLLAKYDKIPLAYIDGRKELAEKATALDPWSSEAHKRLMEVLNEIGDHKGVEVAENTFRRYQEHQPQIVQGEFPTVFNYDGQQISPFVVNVNGTIKKANVNAASRHGNFFYVYADHQAGFAVTTQDVSCNSRCSVYLPVKNINPDGKPSESSLDGIYATNFSWPERSKPLPAVTSEQQAMLTKILGERADHYSDQVNVEVQAAIKSGKVDILVGQLSADGRIFLIGSLHIGSASDEHYSDGYFVSDFVIMEQQKNGSFTRALTYTPYFNNSYCNISGILRDMDGDGADEIITYCNPSVEGPGGDWNGVLQRVKNQWVMAF